MVPELPRKKPTRDVRLSDKLAVELAQIDAVREAWRYAIGRSSAVETYFRRLSDPDSVYSEAIKKFAVSPNAISGAFPSISNQNSAQLNAIRDWGQAQKLQSEAIRKLSAPMNSALISIRQAQSLQLDKLGLRASDLSFDSSTKAAADAFLRHSVAHRSLHWRNESRLHTSRWLDGLDAAQIALKNLGIVRGNWIAPSDSHEFSRLLRGMKTEFSTPIPASFFVDLGSAAVLGELLGRTGIDQQLAQLGIAADGSYRPPLEAADRGILSRRHADFISIVALLLAIVCFMYQEVDGATEQAKTDAWRERTEAESRVQTQKIDVLARLLAESMAEERATTVERFVVRARPASVRAGPKSGASLQGVLLPNEVVSGVGRQGKWVQVEYYHWLREQYVTGWVLKKYLERVPPSYSRERGGATPDSTNAVAGPGKTTGG